MGAAAGWQPRRQNRVTTIGTKLGVAESMNPELDELRQDVRPEKVLETMDRAEQELKEE